MTQKLYALVSNETGRIMKKIDGNKKLGVFVSVGKAKQYSKLYGAIEGNHTIVEYQPVIQNKTIDEIMDEVMTGSYMGQS